MTEKTYENSMLQFTLYETTYHANGNVHYSTPYLNGCIHGTQKIYDKEGWLSMEINWDSDELHGYIYSYNKKGSIIQVDLYRYNSLIDNNVSYVELM